MHKYMLKDVAEFIGCTEQTAGKYESNGKNAIWPPAWVFDKYAELYQVKIWELTAEDGFSLKQLYLGNGTFQDALHIINLQLKQAGLYLGGNPRELTKFQPRQGADSGITKKSEGEAPSL